MLRHHPLLAALLTTTIVVSAVLATAGWRLIEQQRAIDQQQARDRLERTADAIAAGIRGRVAEVGDRLSGWLSSQTRPAPIDGAVLLLIAADNVQVIPDGGLPFLPELLQAPAPPAVLAAAEAAEFGKSSPGAPSATQRYRDLTGDPDVRVRAAAWLRLGRVLRKSRDFTAALAAYQQLTALGAVRTDDLPAELAGLDGQRAVYRAVGDRAGERRIAAELLRGLEAGRWAVTRGMAELYRDELLGGPIPSDSWRLADVVSSAWQDSIVRTPLRGQCLLERDGRSVLVVWRSGANRTALLVAFAEALFKWPTSDGVVWRVLGSEGQPTAGESAPPTSSVTRIVADADHPWTLRVDMAGAPLESASSSRTILVAVIAAALIFVWGATYFMARAIRRERAVVGLQSTFVATVSHEFRSPLTTVRHLAEMLESGRVESEGRQRRYYQVIAGEAARLQRLVETLLDFGAMEAGTTRYRFLDIDLSELLLRVVAALEPQARESGKTIDTSAVVAGVRAVADEHALSVAVRNLLDNAMKYSPDESVVWLQCRMERERAAIRVIDRGMGIPRSEQRAVFDKFVRGRAAIDGNVKGTGIGLSMVQQVVRAHRGEVRLDSEPGRGTTFTLLLPAPAGDVAPRASVAQRNRAPDTSGAPETSS